MMRKGWRSSIALLVLALAVTRERRRAPAFTWDVTARATLASYDRALEDE